METEHADAHFRQSPDEDHNPRAVSIGLLALVIFAGGALWAWLLLSARAPGAIPQISRAPAPAQSRPQVGMIIQYPFDPDAAPGLEDARRAWLDSWGWMDRGAARIHMPIERAMELYLKEQKP